MNKSRYKDSQILAILKQNAKKTGVRDNASKLRAKPLKLWDILWRQRLFYGLVSVNLIDIPSNLLICTNLSMTEPK